MSKEKKWSRQADINEKKQQTAARKVKLDHQVRIKIKVKAVKAEARL